MSGEEIMTMVEKLALDYDVEKLSIEFWKRSEKEANEGQDSYIIKVSIEKEWN